MSLSGKYDFPGIQKLGTAAIRSAFASSPYTAWLLKFSALTDFVLKFIINWAANNGLVILNIGAIHVGGFLDQKRLDQEMDKALDEITRKGGRDKLSWKEKKAIDDEVIKAARKFIVIGKP